MDAFYVRVENMENASLFASSGSSLRTSWDFLGIMVPLGSPLDALEACWRRGGRGDTNRGPSDPLNSYIKGIQVSKMKYPSTGQP